MKIRNISGFQLTGPVFPNGTIEAGAVAEVQDDAVYSAQYFEIVEDAPKVSVKRSDEK